MNFIHNVYGDQGFVGVAAFGAVVASAILFLIWLFLAMKHWRLFKLRLAAALLLGAVGYSIYDWKHISLNLSMREPARVRKDCDDLLAKRRSAVQSKNLEMHLSQSELPSSLVRIGAKAVRVTDSTVLICLHVTSWDGCWGFLYDPQLSSPEVHYPRIRRPAWYHDFYEFFVPGE